MAKSKKTPSRKPVKKAAAKKAAVDPNRRAARRNGAKPAGADAADALYVHGESISVAQRLGAREKLESSEGRDLGLRVFIGKRQAFVSSTDFSPRSLKVLAERAVDMARVVPEDPVCG